MNVSTQVQPTQLDVSRSLRPLALAAIVVGCVLVYTIGFAHSTTLHNAAHDSRHALSFPCH